MDLEMVKALLSIFNFCLAQGSCKECPLVTICEKMPCEWNLV